MIVFTAVHIILIAMEAGIDSFIYWNVLKESEGNGF